MVVFISKKHNKNYVLKQNVSIGTAGQMMKKMLTNLYINL